jgi:DNA-binding transcriptional MerR regulator
MQDLDIGEVAKRAGIPVSALRFYEERKLISAIGRRGLRRQFHASVLDRLALIALGRSAGFTLDEIAQMFGAHGEPRIDRKKLKAKADELDTRIRELIAMRNGLNHAANCRAPSHLECPTFRRMMSAALPRAEAKPSKKLGRMRTG